MAKKKETLYNLLWNDVELQYLRIKDVISKFYPDGVLVELNNPVSHRINLRDSTERKLFSENENIIDRFSDIEFAVGIRDRLCIDIDFFCDLVTFGEVTYDENCILVMFKVNPEDEPVYAHQYFTADDGRTCPRFLVDGESKEAFLVLEDFEVRERDDKFDRCSSFVNLCEFHAIISNTDPDDYEEKNILLVSFSKADKKCFIERVFEFNKTTIDKSIEYIFSNIDNDTSPQSPSKGSEPAAKNGTSSQPMVNDDKTIAEDDANE